MHDPFKRLYCRTFILYLQTLLQFLAIHVHGPYQTLPIVSCENSPWYLIHNFNTSAPSGCVVWINKIFKEEIHKKRGAITNKKINLFQCQMKRIKINNSDSSIKSTLYNIIKGNRKPFMNVAKFFSLLILFSFFLALMGQTLRKINSMPKLKSTPNVRQKISSPRMNTMPKILKNTARLLHKACVVIEKKAEVFQ